MANSSENLSGKTALVTGASGGLGAAIAAGLAKAGARVALHYNSTKPDAAGACIVQADLGQDGFETALLDTVEAQLGPVNILVNCAASQDVAALQDMPIDAFRRMQDMNVTAAFALSTEFARRLAPAEMGAAIVNISSIEATRPGGHHGAYAASKAALEMLTKSMALEYGPFGLRVNAVAPGLIARPEIATAWPDGVGRWERACPLGRMGQPQDIANAVIFLASPAANFINGTVLTVDGGMGVVAGW